MENGDLKRYYKVEKQESKDFARLNADGKIDKDLLPSDVGTTVVANPTGEATADLTKLQVEDTIYAIDTGTEVVANPTLAGTESALTGLQVGDTKYKVDSGISQTDADARYLQLTGGTLTGSITMGQNTAIKNDLFVNMLVDDRAYVHVGNTVRRLELLSENANITHRKGSTSYDVLDADNTQANPTLAGTESNLTGLKVDGTSYKLGYLPLSGGTLTGHLNLGATNVAIQDYQGNYLLRGTSNSTNLGNTSKGIALITSSNDDIKHLKGGGTPINVLDEDNTSANPTLAGTETALTSLKLNGTNYAIAGGTQVTFVDWS